MPDPHTRIAGIRERAGHVRERIAAACAVAGRDTSAVTIVAVTKGHDAETVAAAVAAGLRDIGESRIQATRDKRGLLDATLPDGVQWHLVGQLQSNKARVAATLFDTVHSLDSTRIATALDHARGGGPPLRVLLEVELTGIAGRGGVTPAGVDALLESTRALHRLRLDGLMTVAAPGPPGAARATFARLRGLRDQLTARHGVALPHLSMGMSDDYEVAVEEGATMVRLGRTLFGPRPPIS